MVRFLMVGVILVGAVVVMPSLASQVSAQTDQSASATEDPNDKTDHSDRTFEETRKHMQLHSEWSKKSMKMNDK